MKYCPYCSAQNADIASFCTSCGKPFAGQTDAAPTGLTPLAADSQPAASQFSAPAYAARPQGAYSALYAPELSMKWFEFIIWVQLFLAALTCVINGIVTISGSLYGDDAGAIYAHYGGLKALDVAYGILCLLLAAMAIIARIRLAGFYKSAPALYLIFLCVSIFSGNTYIIAASLITRIPLLQLLTSSNIASSISVAVMLICSVKYFGKRKHLFVN